MSEEKKKDEVQEEVVSVEESTTIERCLTFNAGGLILYISTKYVIEIINNHTITTLPLMPPYIKGIINLRGDVIPVYSLREKFNLEPMNESEENQFIIVKVDDMLLALEVDKVDEIQNISEEMIFDVPIIIKSKETKYAEKIISGNGRIVIIIDIYNLMSDMEMQELSEMVQEMA